MGGYIRILFFAVLALAIAVSGCAFPGQGPGNGPAVYGPISPTPTPEPSAMPASAPTSTPAPTPSATPTLTATAPLANTYAGENYSRSYDWEYGNVRWSFTAIVQKALYDMFNAKPQGTSFGFADHAMAPEDRDCLRSTVSQLHQNGAGFGYTRYDDAMNIVTFVQSVPYVDEHPAGAPKYPLVTLVDGQGDCKDKAVLGAAMLHEAGFDVVLLKFPEHLAVGIDIDASGVSYEYDGARYYYVETTGTNWQIGEIPDQLATAVPSILPLVESPKLQVSVSAEPISSVDGIIEYRTAYTIHNSGPGTAKNLVLKIHALALSRGENVIWDPERIISLGDLAEGQTIQSDASLAIPSGETTCIACIVTGDNINNMQSDTGNFVASM